MHLAKGLGFQGVAVMACDDEIVPRCKAASRLWGMGATCRKSTTRGGGSAHVACTRAQDHLLITGGAEPAS